MNKLLIVVDYQNDFVDGSLGFEKAKLLENPIAEKIKLYRTSGDVVAFTFDTHDKDYLSTAEGKGLPTPHCELGTDGWELYGEVRQLREPNDPCFLKPSFGSSELFSYLREKTFSSIELVGLVSNICVTANAIIAKTATPETRVIVDASCTGSADEKLNTAALDVLQSLQIEVINR